MSFALTPAGGFLKGKQGCSPLQPSQSAFGVEEVPVDVHENLMVLYEQRLSRKDLALVANRRQ